MRKEKITINSLVHIYNRGNRKQEIVRSPKDKWHFLEILYYLNSDFRGDGRPFRDIQKLELERLSLSKQGDNPFVWPQNWPIRKPLVKIIAFCLLTNHFHLILQEVVEGGVSFFMQRFGTAMGMHFNLKYQEVGRIFQGTYKAKIITEDIYLQYLSVYVQVKNTFELYPDGYEKAIKEFDKAWEWAMRYPYCSLADCAGSRNSPIIDNAILKEMFDNNPIKYKNFAKQCLGEMNFDEKLLKFKLD